MTPLLTLKSGNLTVKIFQKDDGSYHQEASLTADGTIVFADSLPGPVFFDLMVAKAGGDLVLRGFEMMSERAYALMEVDLVR